MPRKTKLSVAATEEFESAFLHRGSVVVRDFAIRRCERIYRAFSWLVLTGDRGFESISLHRGVICEPDFLDQGADRRNLVSASNGGPDDGISSEESRGAIQPIISFGTAPPSRARGPPERQTFSVEAR
jgi:hypothetical protein